jgi:hypothetical protein
MLRVAGLRHRGCGQGQEGTYVVSYSFVWSDDRILPRGVAPKFRMARICADPIRRSSLPGRGVPESDTSICKMFKTPLSRPVFH